jgi:hypothetical protein
MNESADGRNIEGSTHVPRKLIVLEEYGGLSA